MNVEFTRLFEKQLDRIKDVKLRNEIAEVVREVTSAKSITTISNIKKLKGHKSAFRIRTGNYRIGVIFHQQTIYFAAVAHRKEIYRIFP